MLHSNATLGNRHPAHNWEVADETAREALSVASADIGKLCWQQDDNSLWILADDSPATWEQVGAGAEYVLPTASDVVLGGIKVGDRLTITGGVLAADVQSGGSGVDAGLFVLNQSITAPTGWTIDLDVAIIKNPKNSTSLPAAANSVNACKLSDGRIFVCGSSASSTATYFGVISGDVITWTVGTVLPAAMVSPRVVTLADDRICVLGDASTVPYLGVISGDVITWTATDAPATKTSYSAFIKLADGRLLTIGGVKADTNVTNLTYFGTVSGDTITWAAGTVLGYSAKDLSVVQLPDGRILVCGGYETIGPTYFSNTRLGTIATNTITWVSSIALPVGTRGPVVLTLPDGKILFGTGLINGSAGSPTATYIGYVELNRIYWSALPFNLYRAFVAGLLVDSSVFFLGGTDASGTIALVTKVGILYGLKKD